MTKDVLTHGTVSSLAEICLESSLRYLESSESWKENTFLPEDICDALICKKLKTGSCDDDFVATYFADVQTSRITKVNVSGAALTDSGLEVLSVHPLREVDVSNCESVSEKAIVSLVKCKNTLTSLNLGNCTGINAFTGLQQLTRLKSLDVSQTLLDQTKFECLSTMVHLRSLNVSATKISSLEPVKTMALLTNLDLSKCDLLESIEPLKALKGTLQWLSLYNCTGLFSSNLIETLVELTQLNHLDLSRDDPDESIMMQSYLDCAEIVADKDFLERLLPSLPALTWLDLSGNTKFNCDDLQLFRTCFPQKLNFLGLFMTDMCNFPEIPADEVSGNGNAKQVLLSVRMYNHRPTLLLPAMRALFEIIREFEDREFVLNKELMCSAVLEAMESHLKNRDIQLAGSASLYHLSRDDDGNPQQMLSAKLKRRVIEVTISAMEEHVYQAPLQRNCCLTLCNFRIASETTCDYKRILRVLLQTAMEHKHDLIQRIAISLCNMLVCQVQYISRQPGVRVLLAFSVLSRPWADIQLVHTGTDGDIQDSTWSNPGKILDWFSEVQDSQKIVVGRDLEGVKKILQIMRDKMENNPERGGVLECCWSALWNVTDETPENCELFILHGGIKLFMDCRLELGDQRDLVRNMLGLMGNVAEVAELRSKLMLIAHVFYDLLETEGQLEVTYNAAGIICHLAFDGPDKWTNHMVSRDQALQRLMVTIGKWDISTPRQMSYRSFAPILRLISGCDCPAIHYWATWALANLCEVDAEKYCKLVSDEGGIELLQGLSENSRTSSRVRDLADMTLGQCRQHVANV